MVVFSKAQQAAIDKAIAKARDEGYAKAIVEGKSKASGVGAESNVGVSRAQARTALAAFLPTLGGHNWHQYKDGLSDKTGKPKVVGANCKVTHGGVTFTVQVAAANTGDGRQ